MELIKKIVQNGGVQIAVVLGGLAITLINLYLASVISPLASTITTLAKRVDAIEERNIKVDPLVERFIVVEERSAQEAKDISEIKESQLRLEAKMDRVIENK